MKEAERDVSFVADLGPNALACRTLRHQFELVYFGPIKDLEEFKTIYNSSTIVRQVQCRRCMVFKEDFFNPTNAARMILRREFTSFYRRYRYPDGYAWKASESNGERPAQGDYNYELFKRYNKE